MQQNTPPCVVLARCFLYMRTTAAVLLYRCTYMAIGLLGGLVGGWVDGLMLGCLPLVGEVVGGCVWVAWYPDPAGDFLPAGAAARDRITLRKSWFRPTGAAAFY